MMRNLEDKKLCTRMCWTMGIVAGVLFFLLLAVIVGFGLFFSLVLGVVFAALCCVMFTWMLCSDPEDIGAFSAQPGTPDQPAAAGAMMAATSMAAGAGAAVGAPVPDEAVTDDEAAPDVAAASEDAGELDDDATKLPRSDDAGELSKAGDDQAVAAGSDPQPAVSTSDAALAEPDPARPDQGAPAAPSKPDAAAQTPPDASAQTPAVLAAARAGGADNLKLISGVGPKLEQTLNELGFFHFDQIAAWDSNDIAWVDQRLTFKGRIERDDWPSQAAILARGEETEFSARKKKT